MAHKKPSEEMPAVTGYPSVDRPWMRYYQGRDYEIDIREESIFQMLERRCATTLDEIALELLPGDSGSREGLKIPYGEYIGRIRECARALAALGIRQNQIVATLLPNIPESRIVIYALSVVGATAYPLSPMLPTHLFEQIVVENNISTVVCFAGFLEKFGRAVVSCKPEHCIVVRGDESVRYQMEKREISRSGVPEELELKVHSMGAVMWEDFIALGNAYSNDVHSVYLPDHVAAIIGTSGTTGTPKGVCLTDRNLNALAVGQESSDHYRRGEKALDVLTQFIGYGISTAHSLSVIGCHTVLAPRLVTSDLPKLLCAVRPDIFPGGPVHYINLARSEEFRTGRVPPVRIPFSGGASLDARYESMLNGVEKGYEEQAGDTLYVRQGYGSTECCGAATACTYGAYKFGSIGIPMATVDVAIFKPGTDEELPYNTEGEICVSGPSVMKGYLNNQEETEKVLKRHSDGRIWLHQADLGWCDESGHIFITDRIKNIFMRMGFNVHPSKIAEFVCTIPGVERCVVVGAPHPDDVTVPVAFVVAASGWDLRALRDAILEGCRDNLEELSVPHDVVFVDVLPVNMGGKTDTGLLLETSGIDYADHPDPFGFMTRVLMH